MTKITYNVLSAVSGGGGWEALTNNKFYITIQAYNRLLQRNDVKMTTLLDCDNDINWPDDQPVLICFIKDLLGNPLDAKFMEEVLGPEGLFDPLKNN